MSELHFKRSHRIVVKSTKSNFGYHTVEIDITNGLYHKVEVDAENTKIRVKSNVFGEQIFYNGTQPLTVKQLKDLQAKFNVVRAERNWPAMEFRTNNESENKMPNTSEV